jgi:hypothetical protein
MVAPGAHADPAELLLAELAGHVVAALVLLDARVAVGALLGVGEDPVGGLRLRHALRQPLAQLQAADGAVRLLAALEAERVVAAAADHRLPTPQVAWHTHKINTRDTVNISTPVTSCHVMECKSDSPMMATLLQLGDGQ